MNEQLLDQIFTQIITHRRIDQYVRYWETITPRSATEYFNRWLFAFMSIHTTWKSNVRGYESLTRHYDWMFDRELLLRLLVESRAGMHNNRLKYISEFTNRFFANPDWFWRRAGETWTELRERLVAAVPGIGRAKVSFVLEMAHPSEANVVCLDTHMCKLYGIPNGNITFARYAAAEGDWRERSNHIGVPTAIARHIYWDWLQRQRSTQYWSYVLEDTRPHVIEAIERMGQYADHREQPRESEMAVAG